MKPKIITLTVLFATFILVANAQSIDISGKIVDKDSNPISGVKVTLKNKSISVYTDNQGKFSIVRNTTGFEINDEEAKQCYFDGQAVYFTCNNQRIVSSVYTITGKLMGQLIAPETYSGTYKFYPSAYLPNADGKIYVISVNMGDQLYSLKIFNANPNYYNKGIQPADNSDNRNQHELDRAGNNFTKNAEEIQEVDKLILEHNSFNTREISVSSYTENLGTISMYQNQVPGISAPSTSDGTFTVTMSYDWGSVLVSSSDRYELEESTTSSGSGFTKINNSNPGERPSSYQVTLTRTSGTYYYRSRVYNKTAFSEYSSVVSVSVTTPSIPNAPSNLTVEAKSPTSIRLEWDDNSNNETGFEIQRQVASNTSLWQVIATTNANATSYNHTGLSETWLGYRVRAVNSGGNSGWTNIGYAPRILRIINDLYSTNTVNGDWQKLNNIISVRIANSQADVENTTNYERLCTRNLVYDITQANWIPPNYNQTSSYEDFEIDSYSGINTKYYVCMWCGYWEFIVFGTSTWWEVKTTKVLCSNGDCCCYKYATFYCNHYNGYLVIKASQFLPQGHWNNIKSTYEQGVSQKQ